MFGYGQDVRHVFLDGAGNEIDIPADEVHAFNVDKTEVALLRSSDEAVMATITFTHFVSPRS